MITNLYRYESMRNSVCIDQELELFGVSAARLHCFEARVVAETPKGYWIGWNGVKEKWVSKHSKKRYAHPTKEEAMAAYRHRKQAYVRHALATLDRAKEDLALYDSTIK